MTREKVIEGLEKALAVSNVVVGTDYVVVKIGEVKKVLELLKEQEPIKPKRTVDEHGQVLSCGNCGAWFEVQSQKYCHECGRKVKWDD